MCGIVGIVKKHEAVREAELRAMCSALEHRGPDDSGVWQSGDGRTGFGHRRLSIIDLSPSGHQPMRTPDGRYTIIFNGEIYNYQALRTELVGRGYQFHSQSDTEVLLYAYDAWKEACLPKLNGMFAFAIWDEQEKKLFAARDRAGEKPFKYYYNGEDLYFASEVKALLAIPGIPRVVDWQAVDEAMSFRFVPSPATGFKDIHKLPAGHFLVWQEGKLAVERYWRAGESLVPFTGSFEDAARDVWETFKESTRLRLVSDVPVGAFLSGGVDSTATVAAITEVSQGPVKTFVVGLPGASEDIRYAEIAARHFGTDHHVINLETIQWEKAITELGAYYDEPFFDQSALPSYLISRAMKPHVTVVLSGDGADELFGGYSAYQQAGRIKNYTRIPAFVRKNVIVPLTGFSSKMQYQAESALGTFTEAYSEYYSLWKRALPHSRRYVTKADLYKESVLKSVSLGRSAERMEEWMTSSATNILNKTMIADVRGRLADGYLMKIDQAAMAAALEVRTPFLDPKLIDLALSLKPEWKVRGGVGKYIWKKALEKHVPQEILQRPKTGFALPLHELMTTVLRPVVEETVLSETSAIAGVCNRAALNRLWKDHCDKKADYSNHLWSLIMLDVWLKKYRPTMF